MKIELAEKNKCHPSISRLNPYSNGMKIELMIFTAPIATMMGLNPYSNGMKIEQDYGSDYGNLRNVLILILME